MGKLLHYIKRLIPKKLFRAIQPFYHFLISALAAIVYRRPSEDLIVIGITGTTGKTTSAYIAAKVLQAAGYKVGYTSTAMFGDGDKEWLNDKKMTMVGRFFTQKMIRQMVKNGCHYAIIETTSEGIRQFRHRFINYDILVFTGLYPEHIESHGSFENYKQAKGELFNHLKRCGAKYTNAEGYVVRTDQGIKKLDLARKKKTIIANGDDEHAGYFLSFWAEKKIVYTQKVFPSEKDFIYMPYGEVAATAIGTSFKADKTNIRLELLGAFNAANAMNAVCIGLGEDLPMEIVRDGLEAIAGIPGRLEKIGGGDFTAIVDYAFEPNAVAKLHETVRLIKGEGSRVIHVLGSAGGGRDVARRPKLGELAGKNSDIVIVTNEDPYDDDPEIIIDQVALGAERAGKIRDRDLFRILTGGKPSVGRYHWPGAETSCF
jgi:UDP-N-acetylmuramoyl-L-alanyl-D-glutamate--2,6-diaminopimelate ligase